MNMNRPFAILSPRFAQATLPILLTALSISLVSITTSHAQTYIGSGSNGLWSNAANWTTSPVLNGVSSASISFTNNPATLSVINDQTSNGISGTYTLNSLNFANTVGSYTLSGAALNFVSNDGTAPSLVLNNSNPVSIASNITLGNNLTVSGSGSATLSGALSGVGTLTTASTGQLQMAGTGSLTFTGGANINLLQITGIGSTTTLDGGTYTLNATNSTSPKAPITVDSTGTAAQLNIQNGALVTSAQNVYIARAVNSHGTATVSGVATQLIAATQLIVGSNTGAVGNFTVQSGALTQSASSFVGAGAGSSGNVTVTGASSRFNATGNITVGSSGTGTLFVQNGGTSTIGGILSIGDVAGSNGSVTVTGSGSSIGTTGNILVGNNTTGTGSVATGALTIQNGGALTAGSTVFIGTRSNSAGNLTVTGSGSSLNVTGQLQVGGQGGMPGGTGQLNVRAGGNVTSSDDLIIYGTGTVTIDSSTTTVGNLSVGGVSNGNIAINNGSLTFGGANSDRQFGGEISGTNATLVKVGSGKTTLSGISTYTGSTLVNGGVLSVDGALAATGAVVINSAATLSGTGSVGNISLSNGGSLGSQRGESLDATSLLWNGGGTLNYQLGGAPDSLNLSGALTKGTGSAFVFSFANNGIGSGEVFNLITFSSLSGFTTSDFSYTGSGVTGSFLLDANRLQFVAAVVPESPTWGLVILGAAFTPFALRQAVRRPN